MKLIVFLVGDVDIRDVQALLGALLALSVLVCICGISFYGYLRVLRVQSPFAYEKA